MPCQQAPRRGPESRRPSHEEVAEPESRRRRSSDQQHWPCNWRIDQEKISRCGSQHHDMSSAKYTLRILRRAEGQFWAAGSYATDRRACALLTAAMLALAFMYRSHSQSMTGRFLVGQGLNLDLLCCQVFLACSKAEAGQRNAADRMPGADALAPMTHG